MDWAGYNAARIRAHYNGERLPTVEDTVLEVLRTNRREWKREEIIDQVHRYTCIDKEELSAHINGILRILESRGQVVHVSTGMWRIK